jgi:hypothetical protein
MLTDARGGTGRAGVNGYGRFPCTQVNGDGSFSPRKFARVALFSLAVATDATEARAARAKVACMLTDARGGTGRGG